MNVRSVTVIIRNSDACADCRLENFLYHDIKSVLRLVEEMFSVLWLSVGYAEENSSWLEHSTDLREHFLSDESCFFSTLEFRKFSRNLLGLNLMSPYR